MDDGRHHDRDDDEFQRRLKSLGYLENPLDKFFIGSDHGRTGILLANLKIALKVGVLGGVFLGVITALGLSVAASGGGRDLAGLAVLAGYFSIIFTVLFTALEFAICLAVTLLRRFFRRLFTRTQMIAFYSGAFAGLAVLLYGTLWWWGGARQGELFSTRSAAAFAVIAAVAAGIAWLTRMAVTALLALLGGAELGARGKGRATKLYFAILVGGFAIFGGYRLATAEAPPKEPSDFTTQPTGLCVTLVALDGASLSFFEHLSQKGELPNLSALAAEGCLAPLHAPALHVNPAVWTTVATGVGPEKHGVSAYSAQEIPGLGFYMHERAGFGPRDALLRALPLVGLSRRSPLERRSVTYPAIWDIIALKSELSGVVNWWGTWPAENFHGFLVTDRMYPKLQAARLAAGPPAFEREIHPRALFDRLADYPLEAARMTEDSFAAAGDIDRFAVTSLLTGRQDYRRLTLTAVYLPGLDIYANALEGSLAQTPTMAERARAVEGAGRYWRFLDTLLEPVLALRGAGNVVILVGDPGMLKGGERHGGARRERGFVLFAGGPAARGTTIEALAPVDIAPALLYFLGFPASAEMEGRAPVEVFSADFVAANRPATVDTYGRIEISPPGEYSVDSQLVERLRSLGYLQQ